MNVRLHLDPDAVAATGSTLAGIAQRMASDVSLLEGTVAGAGNPWGADESGSAFALAYQAVLGHALGALGSYVSQMGDAAVALTMQARAVVTADSDSASAFAFVASAELEPSAPGLGLRSPDLEPSAPDLGTCSPDLGFSSRDPGLPSRDLG
ncbi:hypothetical protein ACTI_18070 [Actinoplanes sp. OR16]|uniref:WXG100 family type VII secretion target n=1 Tax=Actinoplanes sp. OR16 TaxID=946334 RepID=UPI000F6DE387|nr:hypothetical protein [Actinoplanes sp. OR16]BBH65122.1 hypothetical protein ACTI_18070 [Actinoplanes sp. OR16]